VSTRWLAVFSLAAVSCSLVDLSGKIHQDTCRDDGDCEELNLSPTLERCVLFQCNAAHLCEAGLPDTDRDGFIARGCAPAGSQADCDDNNALRRPDGREVCDGLDNDCDGRADEGVLALTPAVWLDLGKTPVSSVQYAVDASYTRIAMTFVNGQGVGDVSFTSANDTSSGPSLPLVVSLGAIPLSAVGASISWLPRDEISLAAYARDAPARTLVGTLRPPAPMLMSTELACSQGEVCVPTPPTALPEIASGRDGVLVVSTRGRDSAQACDADADRAEPHLLLASLLVDTPAGLVERAESAVTLGTTGEGATASALALPALMSNGVGFGWLVASVDLDGTLQVQRVSSQQDQLVVSPPLLSIPAELGPLHAVRLALGSSINPQQPLIGLAAISGCGADAQVLVSVLSLNETDDGELELKMGSPLRPLAKSEQQRAAALSWNESKHSWGVSYVDATGLRLQLVDASGIPSNNEPYKLAELAAVSGNASGASTLTPLSDSYGWFKIFAHTTAQTPDATRISRTTLSACRSPL
jgi:hypothetical protein